MGLRHPQAQGLEDENMRLKRIVAEQVLDIQTLKVVVFKKI